jgi:hypothetical protein
LWKSVFQKVYISAIWRCAKREIRVKSCPEGAAIEREEGF